MCRALFYVKQQDPDLDPTMQAMQFKPGMCVTVIESGEEFGEFDLGPHVRVVEFPNLSVEDFAPLTEPDKVTEQAMLGDNDFVTTERIIGVRKLRAKAIALMSSTQEVAKSDFAGFISAQFETVSNPDPMVVG